MISTSSFKYVAVFSIILLTLSITAFSQYPTPTPTQIPNISNSTHDPEMIAIDDYDRYPRTGIEGFYFLMDNDDTVGNAQIGMASQTGELGMMIPSASCQTCNVFNRVITYVGGSSGNYGVDTGYYFQYRSETISGNNFHSNLARVTTVSTPLDGAENDGYSCPIVGQPVNVTNGNMWLQQTDYNLPALGEQIEINRFYNSIIQTSGMFGTCWSTKYDESLEFYSNKLTRLNMPDGRAVYFTREDLSSPFLPHSPEMYGLIDKNTDGTYTLTFKNGMKHHFDSNGTLQWQKDRNGNQTTLNYDANNVLTGITDSSGRTLTISINTNGLVQNISDSLGTIATYTYFSGTTRLKDVTYQDGSKYKFEYNTTAVTGKVFLETVKDANDKIIEKHEYDSDGRATTSEKEGGVEKYIFDYSKMD